MNYPQVKKKPSWLIDQEGKLNAGLFVDGHRTINVV